MKYHTNRYHRLFDKYGPQLVFGALKVLFLEILVCFLIYKLYHASENYDDDDGGRDEPEVGILGLSGWSMYWKW